MMGWVRVVCGQFFYETMSAEKKLFMHDMVIYVRYDIFSFRDPIKYRKCVWEGISQCFCFFFSFLCDILLNSVGV